MSQDGSAYALVAVVVALELVTCEREGSRSVTRGTGWEREGSRGVFSFVMLVGGVRWLVVLFVAG